MKIEITGLGIWIGWRIRKKNKRMEGIREKEVIFPSLEKNIFA